MSSQDRFGFEWERYSHIDPNYQLQFKNWVYPLTPADFADRKVLDAGCGMGRNSYWALRWGAKMVVAFDYDERSVEAAKRNLEEFGERAEVVFKSIYELPRENEFDLAFSIGVIHHLEDPKLAIQNLVKALKPGGRLLIWVYSYEGNERIVKFVNPVRINVTSKLPPGLVHSLTYFVSIPLWILIKILRGPTKYLRQLSTFKFRHVHSIVFDQLIPRVANYWTKSEAFALLNFPDLEQVEIYQPENKMGWIVTGIKK